ncbi:MAG: twin-arginine translocase TatA/TatE family subunit [Archangiaceae bacterium]|nr:twin-arginine translocase TatA/TatE family subunit [Archangiaceae bacterium]
MRMGTQELIIVFLIVFLLFGASRLPQLGSSLGSAIRNFKKGFGGEEDPAKKDDKAISQGGDVNKTEPKEKVAEKPS